MLAASHQELFTGEPAEGFFFLLSGCRLLLVAQLFHKSERPPPLNKNCYMSEAILVSRSVLHIAGRYSTRGNSHRELLDEQAFDVVGSKKRHTSNILSPVTRLNVSFFFSANKGYAVTFPFFRFNSQCCLLTTLYLWTGYRFGHTLLR